MPIKKHNPIGETNISCALAALVMAVILAAASSSAYAQGSTTRYVYDDNGRLRAVITPNGEANIYEYDAAGNITAIRRNTASTLEVLGFSPKEGVPGTQVTIIGTGFGGGVNAVAFNGTTAQIVSANAPVVVVTVPNGATTGPITVTTPQGSTTTAQPFVVRGVQLTPLSASLNPGQTLQFTAVVFPLGSNQSVTWSVNDVDGGNAAVGTISTNGLYTAPAAFFSSIIVRANSVAEPSLLSEARVMVGRLDSNTTVAAIASSLLVLRQPPPDPPPTISAISAGVLIQREALPTPPDTIAALGAGVLIQREAPPTPPDVIAALGAGVLIQREALPTPPDIIAALGAGVLIQREAPPTVPDTVAALGAGVLIQREAPPTPPTTLTALGAGVSTTTGPFISAISPNQIARGATVSVTFTGANFGGANTIRFSNGSGGLDSNITASNLNVNGSGTSLTATLTVTASATLGLRLIVVSTTAGNSLTFDNGLNTIEIVP